MPQEIDTKEVTEEQFALLVDQLSTANDRTAQLLALLDEGNAVYNERSTAEVVRMRGWLLIALAGPTPSAFQAICSENHFELGLDESSLIYVLEELDTGTDAYLVAAAAKALRSYRDRNSQFASYLMRAISSIRFRDEQVSFANYGEYYAEFQSTSAVGEILATLQWLGPNAIGVLPELKVLREEQPGLSTKLRLQLEQTINAIQADMPTGMKGVGSAHTDCCEVPLALKGIWNRASYLSTKSITLDEVLFEDQDGLIASYDEVFIGRPSIVVFFYTRCENPLKCSLTISKLASVQRLLIAQGLATKIQTIAITYDPEYDVPDRLKRYGLDRGLVSDPVNRMLRAERGFGSLRSHFRLGVNFIDSIVNRHRVEVFVVDERGKIAASFIRLHWDVQKVIDAAATHLKDGTADELSADLGIKKSINFGSFAFSTLASLVIAFFPKCPFCWAAYLSALGVAGLDQIPYSPWLVPALASMMVFNLICLWFRAKATKRLPAFFVATFGMTLLLLGRIVFSWNEAALCGVALTMVGVLWCALPIVRRPA